MAEMVLPILMGLGLSIWLGYVAKTGSGMKHPTVAKRAWCGFFAVLIPMVLLFGVILSVAIPESPPRLSESASSFSQSARRKIYYDIIATQDQNPDSNSWNQEVKEAAAKHYNVPMSTINEIIREGASKGWLQPDPP